MGPHTNALGCVRNYVCQHFMKLDLPQRTPIKASLLSNAAQRPDFCSDARPNAIHGMLSTADNQCSLLAQRRWNARMYVCEFVLGKLS